MIYPTYVEKIIERIEKSGEEAYIVGGCVRDTLLGATPNDFDVTTSAKPETVAELFSDLKVILTGLKHGTVTVVADKEPIEITTFRIDGSYSDSRHPDSVTFSSRISDDLSRRDFTVNAMAYNKKRGLVDLFGGREDLEGRLIRAVGDPKVRFFEDALRILRCFRFSSQLGFEIEENTLAAAEELKDRLSGIAKERILVEFTKLIMGDGVLSVLEKMNRAGILEYIIGENIEDMSYLQKLPLMPRDDVARFGFILSYFGEERAREILLSLKASGRLTKGACAVVRGSSLSVASPLEARRFIADTGIYAEPAILASVFLGNSPEGAYELVRKEISSPKTVSDLDLTGRDIMDMGASGKLVGDTLGYLLGIVIDDPRKNERTTLLHMAEDFIKDRI